MGVKSPAVDTMIAALLRARERPDFVAAVRALDRGRAAPPSAIRRGPRCSAFSPIAGGGKNNAI
jgi:hypothetical protein